MAYPTILFSADGEQYNAYRDDNQIFPYGTQLVMQDGRKYRFARAGGVLLVVGNVLAAAVAEANHLDTTAVASAIASRAPQTTLGATLAAVNLYREGFAVVSITPDGGSTYLIGSHAAVASAGIMTINLAPGFALKAAWTTTSRIDLLVPSYKSVIQSPATTLTSEVVGVACFALAANTTAAALSHGWVATRGPHGVLTSGTAVVGANAIVPLGTAGAAGPSAASTSYVVGRVMTVAAAAGWSTLFLTIDG